MSIVIDPNYSTLHEALKGTDLYHEILADLAEMIKAFRDGDEASALVQARMVVEHFEAELEDPDFIAKWPHEAADLIETV